LSSVSPVSFEDGKSGRKGILTAGVYSVDGQQRTAEDKAPLSISVIMPVYNGIEFIQQSLPPLVGMRDRGEVLEVIVVDDTSSDNTPDVARRLGADVMPSGGRLGPGAARNVAASEAKGDILWFIDADVIVHDDAARVLLAGFEESGVVGVFGSYDDKPPAQNFLSQYKNLVHHYYHQRARKEASTFWSGCGAVRKEPFLRQGGFDVEMFNRPSIEDIELGYRLLEKEGKLLLLTDLQCTHLKEWRFINLIHTEVFCRAIPWARLMLSRGSLDNDLNVGVGERIKAVLAALLVLTVLLALGSVISWVYPVLAVILVVYANKDILRLFYRRKGFWFSLRGLLFHQLYYLYSASAFVWALIETKLGEKFA
jgi:glycosyltransferase involved in cell wall biosynthesis